MSTYEYKFKWWHVYNFFSIKSLEDHISYHGKNFKLTLELKTFKDSSQDCFTMRIHLNNCDSLLGLHDFYIRTFIEDRSEKVQFLQISKIEKSNFTNGKIIWNVKRSDIMAISENLNPFFTTFVTLWGLDCSWMRISEEKFKKHSEENTAHKTTQTDFELKTSSCMKSLTADLCNILKNEAETDLLLKCGDRTFPAHKVILSARSEVFAAMFRSNMSERRDGIVEITDIDPKILKEFLEYVYTGALSDIIEDTAPLLYAAAHKYSIHALQRRCGEFMEENLTEKNACNFLILADTHDDKDFKNRIVSFIRLNESLLSGEEWNEICDAHPKLAIDVYRTLYKSISPMVV